MNDFKDSPYSEAETAKLFTDAGHEYPTRQERTRAFSNIDSFIEAKYYVLFVDDKPVSAQGLGLFDSVYIATGGLTPPSLRGNGYYKIVVKEMIDRNSDKPIIVHSSNPISANVFKDFGAKEIKDYSELPIEVKSSLERAKETFEFSMGLKKFYFPAASWWVMLKSSTYYHVTDPTYAKVILETQTIPAEQKMSNELPWVSEQFEPPRGTKPGLYKSGEPRHILLWKDLEEAKTWLEHKRLNRFRPRAVIIKAELNLPDIATHGHFQARSIFYSPKAQKERSKGQPEKPEGMHKWPRDIHPADEVRLKSAYAYFGDDDLEGKFEVV